MRKRVRRTRAEWTNPRALNRAIDYARRQSSHSRNVWQEMEAVHGAGSIQAKTARLTYFSARREHGKIDKAGKRQRLMDQREGFDIENPYAFQGRLFEFLRQAKPNSCFSIAVIDLDHLKRINDSKGHAAGNRALKAVIAALNRIAKKYKGFAASWTRGDEFRIFAPITARALAEALDAERELLNKKGYSFSAGVTDNAIARLADLPELDKKVERISRQADAALYKAKNHGRNGTIIFS